MEEAWLRIILNDVIAGEDDVAVFGGDGDAAGIGDVMGGMEEMDLPAGDLEGGGWGHHSQIVFVILITADVLGEDLKHLKGDGRAIDWRWCVRIDIGDRAGLIIMAME